MNIRNWLRSLRPFAGAHSGTVPPDGKLPALHGLRGLAALAILLFHLVWVGHVAPPQWLSFSLVQFSFAVQMFFVLSAFSLATSHFARPATTAQYFIKRYFRLAPLFACLVVFQTIKTGDAQPANIALNLSLLFAFVPSVGLSGSIVLGGWSVGVEMVFYILLPVMFVFCGARRAGILFASAALVSYAASLEILSHPGTARFILTAPVVYFASFAAGFFAFFLHRDHDWSRWRMALLIAAIALLNWLVVGDDYTGLHAREQPNVIAMLAPTFAVLCLWQAAFPSRLLTNALMQYLGDRSYGIYLLQFPVIVFLEEQGAYARLLTEFHGAGASAYFVCLAATLLLLLGVVEVGYRLIELPGIALGRRVSKAL